MNAEEQDKWWQEQFAALSPNELPEGMNERILQTVLLAEKKHQRRKRFLILLFVSAGIGGVAAALVWVVKNYGFYFEKLWSDWFSEWNLPEWEAGTFPFITGGVLLFLLMLQLWIEQKIKTT